MRLVVVGLGVALVAGSAALAPRAAAVGGERRTGAEASAEAAGERLGERIEAAIKKDGPFFTAGERAVIERKCGYAPGSWDGYEANIRNGGFVCRDGRRVDDPETRALLAAAEPRIERRVEAAMESADVREAIRAVAEEAERAALAVIDASRIAERAARDAETAVRKAMEERRR